jgi:mannitol/fructose-specific phosphotransferase system IIA component (Ntr-type)
MKLSTLIERKNIVVPILNLDKQPVIEELLDAACATGKVTDRAKALQALMDREKLGSTGLEKGLAIPHARTNAVDGIVLSMGVAPDGVDFQAVDGEFSNLFFLLIASDAMTATYIQVLALIARLSQQESFRRNMLAARTPDEVLDIVKKAEE